MAPSVFIVRPAGGPRRDPGGGDAGPGDHRDGSNRRRDGAPGVRDGTYQFGGGFHRPHRGRVPGGAAAADTAAAVHVPEGGAEPAAGRHLTPPLPVLQRYGAGVPCPHGDGPRPPPCLRGLGLAAVPQGALGRRGEGLVPATFRETIRAGEESGDLLSAFRRAGDYFARMDKTRESVLSALTYPAFVPAPGGPWPPPGGSPAGTAPPRSFGGSGPPRRASSRGTPWYCWGCWPWGCWGCGCTPPPKRAGRPAPPPGPPSAPGAAPPSG